MKIYRRLLGFARPYSKFIIPFFIFTLAGIFFSVFQFALIIPLLNFLFDPVNPAESVKYATAPDFSFTVGFFKDYFYYSSKCRVGLLLDSMPCNCETSNFILSMYSSPCA